MQKIYEVGGILNKGFIGQISYSVCLEKEYENMDICFSFEKEKQRYQEDEITDAIKQEFIDACNGDYQIQSYSSDEVKNAILGNCKTEIHTIAYMNDSFIGGIHKQQTTRHMLYQKDYSSEGCIDLDRIHGVIKLTLVVFNVIKDDTHYSVSLSAW